MTDKKINELLSILDKNELNLDIDIEELSLLSNDLLDKIRFQSKYEIIETLTLEISNLRNRIKNGFSNEWEEQFFPGIFEEFIDQSKKI